jgi:hypothetical protein
MESGAVPRSTTVRPAPVIRNTRLPEGSTANGVSTSSIVSLREKRSRSVPFCTSKISNQLGYAQ